MIASKFWREIVWVAALLAGLVGCGGGGGGGGGGAGFPLGLPGAPATTPETAGPEATPGSGLEIEPSFSTIDLSIDSIKPAAIKEEFFEGAPPRELLPFLGTASGDLSLLTGKTLYVLIEDPDQLFDPKVLAQPYRSGTTTGLMVRLTLRGQLKPGHYTGALKVYACLDARCAVRFKGLPFKLPYDVLVKKKMRFAENDGYTIAKAVMFSPGTYILSLPVKPPEGALNFAGLTVKPRDEGLSRTGSPVWKNVETAVIDDGNGNGTLNITVPPMVTGGKHELPIEVIIPGVNPTYSVLYVNLDVGANPQAPYAIAQRTADNTARAVSSLTVASSLNFPYNLPGTGELLTSAGAGSVTFESFDFVDASGNPTTPPAKYQPEMLSIRHIPAEAPYSGIGTGWGWLTTVRFSGCMQASNSCIAEGEYSIRLRYRHAIGTASQYFDFPVKLVAHR